MQFLFTNSEEGETPMLNIIPGAVKHFDQKNKMTVPHMGWNNINILQNHPLIYNLDNESYFYFVHSYYA